MIHLEGPEERPGVGASMLECNNAHWTYHYRSGYIVTLRGNLSVTLVATPGANSPQQNGAQPLPPAMYKFDSLTFNAKTHDKSIRVERIEGRRHEARDRPPAVKNEPSPMSMSGSSPPQQLEDLGQDSNRVIPLEDALIPSEPVNAFGIPQAAMRCLEVRYIMDQKIFRKKI